MRGMKLLRFVKGEKLNEQTVTAWFCTAAN